MMLLVWVTRRFAFMSPRLLALALGHDLRGSAGPLVEEVVGLLATLAGDLLHAPERFERCDRGANDVVGVGATQALGQNVVDAGALDHRSHGAAGDDARTGGGRLQKDSTRTEVSERLVRNGDAVQ